MRACPLDYKSNMQVLTEIVSIVVNEKEARQVRGALKMIEKCMVEGIPRVCMLITSGRVWINPVRLPTLLVVN